jgi:hypothetical protein
MPADRAGRGGERSGTMTPLLDLADVELAQLIALSATLPAE